MAFDFRRIRAVASIDPCVIVILGASGDLTHRKLIPALYEMNRRGAIDPRTWHGGARIISGGGGKWIVQKFKELPRSRRV